MTKEFKQVVITLTMLLLLACSGSSDNNVEQLVIEKSVLDSSVVFIKDTIVIGDVLPRAKAFYYHNDSMVIILNRKSESGSVLDFYNVKTCKIEKSFSTYGKARDEVLLAGLHVGNGKALLMDYNGCKIFRLNIDSLLNDVLYSCEIIKNDYFQISSLCEFNNKIVAENPLTFCDVSEDIIQDCGPKVVNLEELPALLEKKHKYNTLNVASGGELIASKDENALVYVPFGQSVVDMYDKDLKFYKRIVGPYELRSKYYISEENEVIYSKKTPYAYTQACCNDKFFYLYFVGDYLCFNEDAMDDGHGGFVLKFDWNGNFKKSYYVDRFVYSLTCCSTFVDNDVLYATVNDDRGMPMLIRLMGDE